MPENDVHPTAILDGEVTLGSGNVIGPFCVISGPVELGDDNEIGAHSVIGTRGDELRRRRYDTTGKRVRIGDRCTIREHVTVHKPCYGDVTTMGDDVYLMHGSYVAHDTILQSGAVLAQNAAIGGVSRVLVGGYVAMGAVVHQQTVVGHYAIVAAGSAAVRSVRPFSRVIPGRPVSVNEYAVDRYGFAPLREEITSYVLGGAQPQAPVLAALVAEYDRYVAETGRGEHRAR
jgi:UDP-N-acetylglucosamine acyltransferase